MSQGHDFDRIMLRMGTMNMTLRGVGYPGLSCRDSLAEAHGAGQGACCPTLTNPPLAGPFDHGTMAEDLLKTVITKNTELPFAAVFLRPPRTGRQAGGAPR